MSWQIKTPKQFEVSNAATWQIAQAIILWDDLTATWDSLNCKWDALSPLWQTFLGNNWKIIKALAYLSLNSTTTFQKNTLNWQQNNSKTFEANSNTTWQTHNNSKWES